MKVNAHSQPPKWSRILNSLARQSMNILARSLQMKFEL